MRFRADGRARRVREPELFVPQGTNAEMRWEAIRGQGELTPADRFFVRNHVATPLIDARTWRLRLWGTGLRGAPAEDRPVEFTYEDLLRLPSEKVTAFIECTGNGRGFYTSQRGQEVSGTAWRLGAVGSPAGAGSAWRPSCVAQVSPPRPWTSCRAGWTLTLWTRARTWAACGAPCRWRRP